MIILKSLDGQRNHLLEVGYLIKANITYDLLDLTIANRQYLLVMSSCTHATGDRFQIAIFVLVTGILKLVSEWKLGRLGIRI